MKKYIPVLVILLFGLFAVHWSRGQYMISFADFTFSQNRMGDFYRMFYSWNWMSLGDVNFFLLGLFIPYGIILYLTQLFSISQVNTQIFWNYLLLSSLGLSMYFLVIQFMSGRIKYASGLLSALFFMFNPGWGTGLTMFVPYANFIPMVLGLYIRGLNNKNNFKYIVSISVTWFFISTFSLWGIRGFIFQWMVLVFYLCYFCLQNRNDIRRTLVFTFILLILYVLLNFYWLHLYILNFSQFISGSAEVYSLINYTRLDSFRVNSATIYHALRSLNTWAMTANFKGIYYFPWLNFYQHPILVFLGFIPTLAALASLFYVVKNKLIQHSHVVFFFFLVLFGLFISMGHYNPLTSWMADYVPLFATLFTLPSFHGGVFIAIGYSVLIGYGFMFMYQRIKSFRAQIVFFLLCLVAIMIYGYPIWSGQFIPSGNKVLGAGRYQLPSYVLDLVNRISQEKINYRIFPLPYSILGYYAYNWEPAGFNGPDPLINILNKSEVIGTGLGRQIAEKTTKNIDKTSFFRLNSLLNVKYIMNKRDANLLHIKNNSWYTVPDQAFMNSLYQNNADVSSFGQIDLIKIPDELFLPKLYTPLKVINADDVNELPNIVSRGDYITRSAIYFRNPPNIPNTPNTPNAPKKTILEYRMISPVKYRVRVHNAEGTFPLVMSESFHEGWKTYLTDSSNLKLEIRNSKFSSVQGTIQNDSLPAGPVNETWFKKPIIDDTNHHMVNGYANSWIIDVNKICNDGLKCVRNADGSYDFELVIEFWPQRLYYLGLTVSLTTLLSCMGYIIYFKSKESSKAS